MPFAGIFEVYTSVLGVNYDIRILNAESSGENPLCRIFYDNWYPLFQENEVEGLTL